MDEEGEGEDILVGDDPSGGGLNPGGNCGVVAVEESVEACSYLEEANSETIHQVEA